MVTLVTNNKQTVETVLQMCRLHGAIDLDELDVDEATLTLMIGTGLLRPVVYELTAEGYAQLETVPLPPYPTG